MDRNHFRKIEHSQNINNLRYGKVKKSPLPEVEKVGEIIQHNKTEFADTIYYASMLILQQVIYDQ
nr:hypothetical protein BCU35_13450 [Vibrio lentus]